MTYQSWLIVPAALVSAAATAPAFAVQYLSVEQAQKVLFKAADHFVPADLAISPVLRQQIEQASGVRVRNTQQKIWRAEVGGKLLGWFLLDEVIGKHEFITYAVALTVDGAVSGVEVLDYRETHGGEVREPKWRAQFVGKKHGAPLQLDEDILNLSGATLSCKNITNGVKRILAMYQVAMR